jgi:hypothetical protein
MVEWRAEKSPCLDGMTALVLVTAVTLAVGEVPRLGILPLLDSHVRSSATIRDKSTDDPVQTGSRRKYGECKEPTSPSDVLYTTSGVGSSAQTSQ